MYFRFAMILLLAGCCFNATAADVRIGFREPVYRGINEIPAGKLLNIWSEDTTLVTNIKATTLAIQNPRTVITSDIVITTLQKLFPEIQFHWVGLREIDWRPPMLSISGDRISAAANAAMRRRLHNEFQRIVVRPAGHHPGLSLATDGALGDITIVPRVNSQANIRSRMAVPVDIISGSAVLHHTSVWLAIEAYRVTPVFAHAMQRGDVPTTNDVRLQAVDFARVDTSPLSIDTLTGEFRLKQAVRAGDVLTRGLLEPAPDVSKGEHVKIELTGNTIVITAWGIAKTEGFTGETIKVLIDNAEAPVFARITGKGETKIEL